MDEESILKKPEFIYALIAAAVLLNLLFFLTLQNLLRAISPECRKMKPAQVWLNLIPVLNIIWIFHTISCISQSLRCEYFRREKNIGNEKAMRTNGYVYVLINAIAYFVGGQMGVVLAVVGSLCFILYWGEAGSYLRKLKLMKGEPYLHPAPADPQPGAR